MHAGTMGKWGAVLSKIGRLVLVFVVIVIAYLLFFRTEHSYTSQKEGHIPPLQTPEARWQHERSNPPDYLLMESTMHYNFMGEVIVEGHITNTASFTAYGDMILRVDFLDENGKAVLTHFFNNCAVLSQKQSARFRHKTTAPSNIVSHQLSLVSADSFQ